MTNTPKCNPVNYLDVLTGIEDNADFVDGSNTNGFINGVIRDANKNVIVNDRLITITYQNLIPVLQRRVAKEVLNCLTAYAGNAQNYGRYPWAAPVTNITTPYADAVDTTFGRVPDTLNLTELGGAGGVANLACPASPTVCMSPNWPTSCGITQGSWWTTLRPGPAAPRRGVGQLRGGPAARRRAQPRGRPPFPGASLRRPTVAGLRWSGWRADRVDRAGRGRLTRWR